MCPVLVHSTESALLQVFNNILLLVDSGVVLILLLLDLTAAFDTTPVYCGDWKIMLGST